MDPLQQPMAAQPGRSLPSSRVAETEASSTRPLPVVPGHEIVDRREEQPVAGLVVAQPLAPDAFVAHVLQSPGRRHGRSR